MARETGPVCRRCRREGMKLFLKGNRCDTDKCAVERRQNPPGMHTFRRGKQTDYGTHLREKQKVKHYYGVLERQFRRLFAEAQRGTTDTGKTLMTLLELRLDNVVHRLGFATSRAQAKQMILHGHIVVNGGRVDIPSYQLRVGDVVAVKNRAKSLQWAQANLAENHKDVPEFLSLVPGQVPEGHVLRKPEAEDVSLPVQPQLIVELLAK